ncbi:MAG TPA: cytidylate kinase family protein [Candidatus Acidoferrales bacterium]|nr:cytidylate kinase family protein [Candidatus Acidoferrales bacterium]
MPIITIFGSTFGDDEAVAKSVADAMGYAYVSRELFIAASQRYGIPEAKLNDIVEKEPHWWQRWVENLRPYRVALQAAMCEVAERGNVVYYGHIGHGLLPGIRHVLKVLLLAPMQFRIEQVRARQGFDAARARRHIDHVDKAHSRRLMALFGTDWREPGQYALILNMAQMSPAAACRLIVEGAKLEQYQPTAASEQDLRDLSLGARVQAALALSPALRGLMINVEAKGGVVTLSGFLRAPATEQEIRGLVESVPGVSEIRTDFVTVPSRALRAQ